MTEIRLSAPTTDSHKATVEQTAFGRVLNGNVVKPSIVTISNRSWQVNHKGRAYRIDLLKHDLANSKLIVRVNGVRAELDLTTTVDRLYKLIGMERKAQLKVSELRAPMPGLVRSVLVEAGTQVEKGQPLVVLEAMKMENVLKAPDDLTVSEALVQAGVTVDKNAVLLRFA